MGLKIDFQNHCKEYANAIPKAKQRALERCGSEGEGIASGLAPVDTGRLRGSITHKVDGDSSVDIGTNCEYAAYVELGTGVYSTMGGGRKTPWVYQDSHGQWHMTNGQRAQPYLKPAVADNTGTYRNIIESEFKNG